LVVHVAVRKEESDVLVLTRKPNESIIIGDDIEIMIVRMLPDRVKIGIKAPDNVAVHRKEVAQTIARKLKHGDVQK
jgi:carbon storage regulator